MSDFGPNYSLADVPSMPEHRIAELESLLHEYKDAEHRAVKENGELKAEIARLRALICETSEKLRTILCLPDNQVVSGDHNAAVLRLKNEALQENSDD
jgi:hypothetical protein